MFTFAIKSLRTPQFGRLTAALLALWLLTTTARAHPAHDDTAGVANTPPPSDGKPDNSVTITTEDGDRIIKSNGWPDHAPGAFPRRGNPNTVAVQNYTFRLPLKPKIADEPERRGGWWWGVALNGVPFEPGTAETWNNDPRSGWRYEAATGFLNLGLDEHNAHVQPNGSYHYHALPTGLVERLGGDGKMMRHLGWAADGFPIYSAWAHGEAKESKSELRQMKPGYRLKQGARPDQEGGPGGNYDGRFTQDFEFVKDSGDLDECNGRSGVTPEFPDGTYYYCLTAEFPFVPRMWRGTPDPSFNKGDRPPGGGPGRMAPGGAPRGITEDGLGGPPPPGDDRPRFSPLMQALDADGNHLLDAGEIKNAPDVLKKLDLNGDGELTPNEYHPGPPVALPAPTDPGPAPRPNIILCMTDDQGWGDVSYNGLTKIKTPNMDAMAAAGLRFNRFYAQQSCTPTRASVMTGRHPNRMGVFWPGMPLRKNETTIAQLVKQSGYATGHFGKWHLNGVAGPGKVMPDSDPLAPRNVGFHESFSVTNYFETDWTFGRNGVPEKASGDGSEVIVGEALKFIGAAAEKKTPFFAVVWFGSPHVPHAPLPADLTAAGGSGYYGELIAVDRSLGTLRAGLRKLGIADNTMLWFSSDNGGWHDPKKPDAHGTNANLRGRKGDMWEGGIRVPGIIEWPARIKPAVTDIPAGVVDIFPTLVDLLQLKVEHPVPLDGISLLPLLDGKLKARPQPLGFWQFAGDQKNLTPNSGPSAWNDNQYKLVKPKPGAWELYDIAADRTEQTNIAAEHPEVVARMKAEMETWQQSVIRSYNGADAAPQ